VESKMSYLSYITDWILSFFSDEAKLQNIINGIFTKEVQVLIFDLVVLAQTTTKEDGTLLSGEEKKKLVIQSLIDIKGSIGENIKVLINQYGQKAIGNGINMVVELLKMRKVI